MLWTLLGLAGVAGLIGLGLLITQPPASGKGQAAGAGAFDLGLAPPAGRRAVPATRFLDGDGARTSLAAFRGRVVLLNFWATWCGPCRAEMPSLDRLAGRLAGADFVVVPVSEDRGGLGDIRPYYAQLDLDHLPVYLDPQVRLARQLRVKGLPTTVFIDRDGNEIGRMLGWAEWDSPTWLKVIRGMIGAGASGKPRDRDDAAGDAAAG